MNEKTKSERKKKLKEVITQACIELGLLLDENEKYYLTFSEPLYVQLHVHAKD
jgi:hypothetical protein